jgi:UDP-3-O-[3-hydroxymyristoyl] glucosamine N-acyltransferase
MSIVVFGAGGLALQIIDSVPRDTRFVTDTGGGRLCGRTVEAFSPHMEGELVIAVNDMAVRSRVAATWRSTMGRVIAASAEVSAFADVADGVIVCRQAIIEATASIGQHSHVNLGAKVGHGTRMGRFATIGPGAMICGDCTLGDGVRIGAGAIIREGITIGDGATVSMGALVHRDVPSGAHVIGGRLRPALTAVA